jgi:hypothetical protein
MTELEEEPRDAGMKASATWDHLIQASIWVGGPPRKAAPTTAGFGETREHSQEWLCYREDGRVIEAGVKLWG